LELLPSVVNKDVYNRQNVSVNLLRDNRSKFGADPLITRDDMHFSQRMLTVIAVIHTTVGFVKFHLERRSSLCLTLRPVWFSGLAVKVTSLTLLMTLHWL